METNNAAVAAAPARVNGRKVFLINPKFQLTFIFFMIGLAAVAIAIIYAANVYFFWKFRQMGEAVGLSPDHVFFQFLSQQRHEMNWVFVGTSVAVFTLIAISGIMMSHWVAGPLYRLHKHMLAIAGGRTGGDVKFRKRDFFPELADAFNAQLHFLKDGTKAEPPAEVGKQ
jgi:hypothetical protein